MDSNQKGIQIRTKKIGLLMMDARKTARWSEEECAQAMGITKERYLSFENGTDAPSLPEIETFAFTLNIPLEHFWGNQTITSKPILNTPQQTQRLMQLRNRIIGTIIRVTRNKLNFSVTQLSEKTGIPDKLLSSYELGEKPIPLPELEMIAKALDKSIESFFDTQGTVGNWNSQQKAVQKFLELSPEVREFICKPVNRPYLELTIRLSELSAEKLRSIAESLLEITY